MFLKFSGMSDVHFLQTLGWRTFNSCKFDKCKDRKQGWTTWAKFSFLWKKRMVALRESYLQKNEVLTSDAITPFVKNYFWVSLSYITHYITDWTEACWISSSTSASFLCYLRLTLTKTGSTPALCCNSRAVFDWVWQAAAVHSFQHWLAVPFFYLCAGHQAAQSTCLKEQSLQRGRVQQLLLFFTTKALTGLGKCYSLKVCSCYSFHSGVSWATAYDG